MRAVVFHEPFDVRAESVPDPGLEGPSDAVVEIEIAAICGSDLHPYRGKEVGLDKGTVMGHEFVGRVAEAGGECPWQPGQKVVAPFTTSCGECFYCKKGLTARCDRGQLFGWVEGGQGLEGGQAEYVRVPMAETTLVAVPEGLDSDIALFAGDILSTGLFVTDMAGLAGGERVAVVGCGPVGLMAVLAALDSGASWVAAIDPVADRRQLAESMGAQAFAPGGDLLERVRSATEGRGVDAVLEMVGSPEATRLAIDLVRAGGVVAAAGVHTESAFSFSPGEAYDKNLTYRAGRCSARAYLDRALSLAASERSKLELVVTHRVSLEEVPEMYRRFDRAEPGCVKVLVDPRRGHNT